MGYVMSGFGATGTESGYTPPPDDLPPPEGYPPVERCSDYIIRGDGWCADTSGVYPLSWYDIADGRCTTPPPISCDVNAPNLPDRCPSGEILNSAVPTGCSPRGKPKGSKGIIDETNGDQPARASFELGAWIRENPLPAAMIIGGAILALSSIVPRSRG